MKVAIVSGTSDWTPESGWGPATKGSWYQVSSLKKQGVDTHLIDANMIQTSLAELNPDVVGFDFKSMYPIIRGCVPKAKTIFTSRSAWINGFYSDKASLLVANEILYV